ncbi:MAG TPA: AlpA family phage regulatory protein [Steroidobacter sp.]
MTPEPRVRSMRILRLPDVIDRVGLQKTQIYDLMKRQLFPQAMKLSVRAVGWFEHEIDAYLTARAAQREAVSMGQNVGANVGANHGRA